MPTETGAMVLSDQEIREALRGKVQAKYGSNHETVIIDELGVCQGVARVDVAVVNGTLHGYEIKSDRDSLRRLQHQVDIYGKVLEYVTVVIGERHLDKVFTCIPSWWGVTKAVSGKGGTTLVTLRRARRNPERDPRALVELLWREEALALLESRNAARGVRGKPRRAVWERLCEEMSLGEIAAAVRERLKVRSGMKFLSPHAQCDE